MRGPGCVVLGNSQCAALESLTSGMQAVALWARKHWGVVIAVCVVRECSTSLGVLGGHTSSVHPTRCDTSGRSCLMADTSPAAAAPSRRRSLESDCESHVVSQDGMRNVPELPGWVART
jgi:hypothetical protein